MIENLTQLTVSPANLIIRALVVYFFILGLLRFAGKRQIGQASTLEFVAILLISNAVQNSMNGGDNSLVGGMILAVVLIFASWAISFLSYRSSRMRVFFEGTPTLLIHKGKALRKNMDKERINIKEMHSLLRRQGVHHVHDVYSAVLEPNGVLSIIRAGEETLQTTGSSE